MFSRQMIPVTVDAELERYVSLIPRERAAAPGVSGEHRSLEIGGHEAVYSQIVLDDPSVVADRKSTRLNSSHVAISYAVFCLKKKRSRPRVTKQKHQTTH